MVRNFQIVLLLFCLLSASSIRIVNSDGGSQSPAWVSKIDPFLLAEPQVETVEALLILGEQGDLSAAQFLETKEEKGQFVYETLTAVARITQAPLIAEIEALGLESRSFWIHNMIWVEGDWSAIEQLAQQPAVVQLVANPQFKLETIGVNDTAVSQNRGASVEWNLSLIRADHVWDLGYTGQGVTVGGQDTGYNWTHPGLINQYRGWDGNTAVHDYNWHDTVTSGGNMTCGSSSPEPCDDFSSTHGTHTMGTMVGTDGNTHTGVAPGAEWIGCRNMNNGNGTPASYTACYEWFVAPYPIGGDPMTDGDPSKAPHVINNSWSCPASEGCNATSMQTVVQNVRSAGIVTVHSAGNSGPSCNTITNPGGHFAESFTVGSTTSSDSISSFSSRGDVTIGMDTFMKPNISAPGSGILSTVGNNSYGYSSGTSMAAPHVAGLVALIISADPSLAGDVDAIEQIIEETARGLTTNDGCGGDLNTAVPNNTFGYGRIDALRAVLAALNWESTYLPLVNSTN